MPKRKTCYGPWLAERKSVKNPWACAEWAERKSVENPLADAEHRPQKMVLATFLQLLFFCLHDSKEKTISTTPTPYVQNRCPKYTPWDEGSYGVTIPSPLSKTEGLSLIIWHVKRKYATWASTFIPYGPILLRMGVLFNILISCRQGS